MFILGDESNGRGRIPWVTWGLIATNLLVFTLQMRVGEPIDYGFSLIPAEITQGRDLTKPQHVQIKVPVARARGVHRHEPVEFRDEWVRVPQYPGPMPIYLTLLTSLFLHANLMHLVGNLWFLYVFGDNVEHALRPVRFLGFYLLCGVVGGITHVLTDPQSVFPCMGASGAISGVLGAYVSIYPLNKVRIWLGWWWGIIEVPAFIVLGIWFVVQYLYFAVALTAEHLHGGVAYGAHVGGFVAGLLYIWGLIGYLKWQLRRAPDVEPDPPMEAPAPEAPDPYDSFLPAARADAVPSRREQGERAGV